MALILLADDDDEFRISIREMLERLGHTVIEAANGKLALEVLETEPVDLLILDIVMPDMDGIETLMAINPKTSSVKVLVISGGGRINADEYLHQARLFGARATLQKPFTGEALKSTLQTLGL